MEGYACFLHVYCTITNGIAAGQTDLITNVQQLLTTYCKSIILCCECTCSYDKLAFSSKADHPQICVTRYAKYAYSTIVTLVYIPFCSCDLCLDPMTLIYGFDLPILNIYLHTKYG